MWGIIEPHHKRLPDWLIIGELPSDGGLSIRNITWNILKTKSYHDANFFITGTGGCQWQPPVPPVMPKLASWQLLVFSPYTCLCFALLCFLLCYLFPLVRCDMAFIEPMYRNKPNITYLLFPLVSYYLSILLVFRITPSVLGHLFSSSVSEIMQFGGNCITHHHNKMQCQQYVIIIVGIYIL